MDGIVRHGSPGGDVSALGVAEADVVAIAEAVCDRIEESDGSVLAFLPEPGRRDRLRAQAGRVLERWPDPADRPALYGVPVGIKDIIHVDGLPTRAGSSLPPTILAGAQAGVVDRLQQAGALVAGKTVTAEFAVTAPGPTRNPHHLGHTPGGSSSGSAAAVAAGMVPLAIGTQTVGSVIRPAAYCGVVGFRPTYGRIPVDGVIPNVPGLDTVGTFTTDAAGAALAAAVLCDGWRPQPGRSAPGLPVLAIPSGPYLRRADAVALDAFDAQVNLLREAGHTVREVPYLGDLQRLSAHFLAVNRYEVARTHARWFPRFGPLYRPQTARAIRQGHAVGPHEYALGLRELGVFRDRLDADMAAEGIDAWITPAATGPAPRGLESTGDSVMSLPWSGGGLPAVTLPAGRAPDGLPLGLQCVGRRHADERLLMWAAGIEAALAGARAA